MIKTSTVLVLLVFMIFSCTSRTGENQAHPEKTTEPIALSICMQNPNIHSFLPYLMQFYNDSQIYDLLYNTLITANHLGSLYPEIAESWQIKGREYRFKIRENIHFHNGKILTADDVFFTLEQLVLNTHRQNRELYYIEGVREFIQGKASEISGLEKKDDFNFIIRLNNTFNYFLHFLSSKFCSIIPDGFAGLGKERFLETPVGTGPFQLKQIRETIIRHRPFTEYVFTRHKHYFSKRGNIDRINFFIPLQRERLKTLKYFDIFLEDANFDPDEIQALPDVKIVNSPPDVGSLLCLNPRQNPFLKRVEIRQLINHSINREKLVKELFSSRYIPAHSIIPASLFGHNPYYRIDYKKAARLQARISDKNGSFTLLIYPPQTKIAKFIKRDFKQIGINVQIKTISAQEYFHTSLTSSPSSFIIEGLADYPTPYNFFNQLYEKNGVLNYINIQSPEILKQIKTLPETDLKSQAATLSEINQMVETESIYIPLFYNSENLIIKNKIKTIIFKYGGVIDFSSLEVKDE
jgi:ABC-type transport system substrate-binding protein